MEEPPDGDTVEWPAPSQFGHYVLKRLLGRGGFGEVYEAVDTNKNRTVALKVLPPSISANPTFRKRLFREASTAGRLHEPHVVPIHDYGEIDGQLYIDMRLIQGTDLRAVLDESGPLEPERAVGIIGQVASALDAAHAEQIVHRDVKPANILLTGNDFVCLVDFGLASAATDAKVTTTGAAVGTFAYMAPERFSDEPIDQRADVYALACVLYECLTGASPYHASQPAAVIASHLTAPIPRPSQQRPDIRPAFDDVIARGMAKNPDDRYSSAGQLAEAARRALASPSEHRRESSPRIRPIELRPTVIATPASRRPSRITVLTATAVLTLAVAAAIPYWLSRHHHSSSGSSATANTIVASVTAKIHVGKHPEGVAVDPTTRTAYTANNRDDTASAINTSDRVVTATIPVGTNPWGVAVDSAAHTAYVVNNWDNTVSVIDTGTATVAATIPVGKHPQWVAVDPTTHTAYTTNNSDGTVSVIDTANHTVTTATINVGNGPMCVVVDPTAHAAYTTNYGDGTVSVIDTTSRAVTATIKVGANPWGVAVDPTTHIAYTGNSGDGTVSVIDTAAHTVIGTINVGNRLWAVAVDPLTHTAYTANSDDTVSVIEPTR